MAVLLNVKSAFGLWVTGLWAYWVMRLLSYDICWMCVWILPSIRTFYQNMSLVPYCRLQLVTAAMQLVTAPSARINVNNDEQPDSRDNRAVV